MPRVGIVSSPQPNAFATGRGPSKAVVVATSSILQTLTPTELEAVIGHEIGHVVHRDVLTSSVAATIAGVISYIGNIALYSMMFGGRAGNNRQGGNPIALVAAIILVPLGATFVRLGISRGLEYNADEYGAKLTQNPGALASALQKISAKVQTRGMSAGGQNSPGWPFAGDRVALDSEPLQGELDARALLDPPVDAAQGREAEEDRPADGRLRPVARPAYFRA